MRNEITYSQKKHGSMRRHRIIANIATYVILAILVVIWLYPILWIFLNAFRCEYNENGDLIGIVVSNYIPKQLGFENFKKLFTETQFLRQVGNTLIVSVFSCILSTLLTLSTAYIMSKIKFKMRKPFMNLAMILGLFPGFMSMIAIYFILKALGLTQTLLALILCYSAGAGLGFYVAKGFFDTVPNALVESAKLDGATQAQVFWHIILPLSKPIIIYTALLAFTGPWMDFIFARVILGEANTELHTVAVGLYQMMYGAHADNNIFTTFAAGCVCIAVPIVTLFLCMQKYYIEGATAGAVKG
ncbi:putative uncharacterized protein [Corallococcus sp. CAG:1435]|nr:putative uncharacterized protein [Corallococcus sp. CAG:1435]